METIIGKNLHRRGAEESQRLRREKQKLDGELKFAAAR
jgi:hypothetical protein